MKPKVKSQKAIILLFSISNMFTVIALSWVVLYHSNFFYSFWHDNGGIKQTIEHFSPKNTNIKGFENTTKAERVEVFKQINYAVHVNKSTLNNITFHTKNNTETTLLTQAEIIHLVDVANLIQILYYWFTLMLLVWAYLLIKIMKNFIHYPSFVGQAIAIGSIFGVLGLIIAIVGPTKFFYWLHEVIFPDNHQWFFYYQESLMSTLMSAPDLFGWIALEWVLLFIIGFYTIHKVLKALHTKLQLNAHNDYEHC